MNYSLKGESLNNLKGYGNVELSLSLKDLLSKLLVVDPRIRLSMSAVTKHHWFKEKDPLLAEKPKQRVFHNFYNRHSKSQRQFELLSKKE